MGFENGQLVRVTLRAVKGTRQEVNTFHYDLQNTPGETPNSAQDLADTFRDDVRPAFAAIYDTAWTIDPVQVVDEKDPQNPLAPRESWTSGAPIAGTYAITGDLAPSAVCAVATLRTAKIGRRFRGRVFIGGTHSNSHIVGNDFTAGYMTFIGPYLAAVPFQPDIVPGGGIVGGSQANWCVYSRTQRAADLDPYAEHVTAYATHNQVHWLRRRAGIVG